MFNYPNLLQLIIFLDFFIYFYYSGIYNMKSPKKIRKFNTGAVRDVSLDKENYIEGISWLALQRFARYMDSKAVKYGTGNWQKGIPSKSYIESLLRHVQKFISEWQYGICVEKDDHLSAIAFNLFGLMHELELYKHKKGRIEVSEEYNKIYKIKTK